MLQERNDTGLTVLIDLSVAFFERSQMWSSVSDKLWLEVEFFRFFLYIAFTSHLVVLLYNTSSNISPPTKYAMFHLTVSRNLSRAWPLVAIVTVLCLTLSSCDNVMSTDTMYCRLSWPLVCLIGQLTEAIIINISSISTILCINNDFGQSHWFASHKSRLNCHNSGPNS